jgi:hypothetical protein
MSSYPSGILIQLAQAGEALYQVLSRFDQYAKKRAKGLDMSSPHAMAVINYVHDTDKLIVAIKNYEEVVLSILSLIQSQQCSIAHLSPIEVRAARESDPIYQLGYQRGFSHGTKQEAATYEKAIHLYAQHAVFPSSLGLIEPIALVDSVRLVLSKMSRHRDIRSAYSQ